MTPARPRVLVVGCGDIATQAHLPALKQLEAEGLVTVSGCDADPSRAAAAGARFEIPTSTDWRAAAADADAVVVCVAPGPNAVIATAAVGLGLHVLCEKPPGRTVHQARAMAEAAAGRPDLVTMVGFNRRYFPLYQRIMDRAADLGPPTAFYGRFSRDCLGGSPSNTASDWITSDSCHALDLAVATMGFPTTASVSRRVIGSGPDSSWTLLLESERGAAALFFHYAAGRRVERYDLLGPGWRADMEPPASARWTVGGAVEEWTSAELTGSTKAPAVLGFVAEHRCFLDAVTGRGPRPEADFAYGSRLMALMDGVLRAPTGTVVDVGSSAAATAGAATVAAPPLPLASDRPTVLLHHPLPAQARFFGLDSLTGLADGCRVVDWNGAIGPDLEAAKVLVTGRGAGKLPPDVWSAAPALGLVVWLGASVRGLDPEALLDRGVALCNTADAVARSVAEHCLALALAGLDLAGSLHRPPEPARTLRGAVVGLVGWGHTARRFAELLVPFDVELLVASEAAPADELAQVGAAAAALDHLLASSLVISLHKGVAAGRLPFLGPVQLDAIRPGTVLVNTARAELFDEGALLSRLGRGDMVAALDVFHSEPLAADHPLRSLANVLLTPHTASATVQEERRMGEQALATVRAWIDGRPVPSIDRARLVRMT